MDDILEGGARRAPKKRSAPKRVARRPAPKRVARKSAPKRSAPKRSAPKRSAPKRSAPKRVARKSAPKRVARRSAPKRSAPKKSVRTGYVYKNGRKYVSGYYRGLQKLSSSSEAAYVADKALQNALKTETALMCKDGVCRKTTPRGCVRQYTKKYMERPSPPYPASECIGTIKVGNDGNLYISKQYASGEGRWILHKNLNLQLNSY